MRYTEKVNKGLCRKCINEKYGADLLPEDCKYFTFPAVCPMCGKVNNIVVDVRLIGRRKLWFKKEKKLTPTET